MKFSAVPLFRAVFPVLLIVAGGCSIFPTPDNTETLYYDLDIPERCNTDLQIEVSPFTTMTSERYRMATRGEDNVIHGREFHKWVQTPGPLVTKYLRLAYRDNASGTIPDEQAAAKPENIYHLTGTVLVFEADKGMAKLGHRYVISRGKSGEKNMVIRTILVTDKMADDTPGEFADAMSRAVAKASRLILADIETMAKNRKKDAAAQ